MKIHEMMQDDGTFDLSIEMNNNDIDLLIKALNYLKENNNYHFHIVNNFNHNKNKLCDLEISYNSSAENDFEALISPEIYYRNDTDFKNL